MIVYVVKFDIIRTDFPLLDQEDDSPFETFELPWAIQIFGKSAKYTFISPNGAIHLYKGK